MAFASVPRPLAWMQPCSAIISRSCTYAPLNGVLDSLPRQGGAPDGLLSPRTAATKRHNLEILHVRLPEWCHRQPPTPVRCPRRPPQPERQPHRARISRSYTCAPLKGVPGGLLRQGGVPNGLLSQNGSHTAPQSPDLTRAPPLMVSSAVSYARVASQTASPARPAPQTAS